MQLVAYGAQDIYLTGNPQITFFKVVYRRHTNFSMEAVAQTFSGTQVAGGQVSSTITRNGDLIGKMYYQFNPRLVITLPAAPGSQFGANVGNTLFNEIELEIGGQRIDKHYGHWLTVWNQLTQPNYGRIQNPIRSTAGVAAFANTDGGEPPPGPGASVYQLMTFNHQGPANAVTTTQYNPGAGNAGGAPVSATVPFEFWFNRNPGLALPLIALQYHEVKVNITFAAANAATPAGGNVTIQPDPNGQLWVDYIYLDTDERRRFAQQSHEYLIEQLQFQTTGPNQNEQLNFNHPVKELIWTGPPVVGGVATPTTSTATPIALNIAANDLVHLKLNGHDRMAPRHPFYYTRTQINQHHTGEGGITIADSIAVYSFALKPEEHQPSGTCNFSRIDNAQLVQTNPLAGTNVYAVNYNVLRIMSGMGGLAYSN